MSPEDILKMLFLFCMESMGISDKTILEYNCTFIAKNSDEKKLNKLFEESLDLDESKMIFFSAEKQMAHVKRQLDRVCRKIIVNGAD